MKVFISWSGPKSKAVALALHEWAPFIINEAKTFMSADSIESGQRWSPKIAGELEATDFGIICTTAANQYATWLNFEAGALAKRLAESRVAPIAIDLAPSEIKQPLGQFNGDPLTLDGIRRVMHSMNSAANVELDTKLLDTAISKWWPDLEAKVQNLPDDSEGKDAPVERTDRDMLLELVDSVRAIMGAQSINRFGDAPLPYRHADGSFMTIGEADAALLPYLYGFSNGAGAEQSHWARGERSLMPPDQLRPPVGGPFPSMDNYHKGRASRAASGEPGDPDDGVGASKPQKR